MVRCFWWNSGLTSRSVVRRLVEQHVSTSVLWCTVTALNETCMINKSSAAFYIAPLIIKHKRTKEIGLSTLFLKSMNLNHINFHVVWHDKVECVVVRISYKTTRFTCSTIWYMYNVNMIVWFLVVVAVVTTCTTISELLVNWDTAMEFLTNFTIGFAVKQSKGNNLPFVLCL